ncbi:hypothetical protein [Actinacidiphila glaucinigra]|uniref:hypothetical protein n=1 Tax=Actinacidiphila glaucinigra TaxID=235986 RepID=UPI00380E72EA
MRDPAGGTALTVGLLVLGGVQILNIGLAVIVTVGGLAGLARCLLVGDHGHRLLHAGSVVAATAAVVMSFALPVGYLPCLHV